MKKILLILASLLSPFISQASSIATPSTLNQQTLSAMLQVQQQETQLQQQLVNMQQRMLTLQRQQFAIQHNLLLQITQPISSNYKWLTMAPASNVIPANRIDAGLTGGPAVYICHAQYQNLGVHPGTLTPMGCLISYAGKSYIEAKYQVLTGTGKISWQPSSSVQQFSRPIITFGGPGPMIPRGLHAQNGFQFAIGSLPIIGGDELGRDLYICRTIVNNTVHVGKVVSGNCNVGYNGKELTQQDFQVLFSDGG